MSLELEDLHLLANTCEVKLEIIPESKFKFLAISDAYVRGRWVLNYHSDKVNKGKGPLEEAEALM